MNITKQPKLILIDCDGVLYHPSELDIDAMVFAFNTTCEELSLNDKKLIKGNKNNEPVKGVYNYIEHIAQEAGLDTETFISKVVAHIDYSHITPDSDGILEILQKLANKFKICICTNNALQHVNQVIKAKFNISPNQLPFEIFDATYASIDGIYYPKQSDVFIRKLEKHFGINAADFFWIDDDMGVVNNVAAFGCEAAQITQDYRLIDALNDLLR